MGNFLQFIKILKMSGQKGTNIISPWSLEYLMGNWRPEIGDPSFMGWFTVGSYFACSILALIVSRSIQETDKRGHIFWRAIGLSMILLGINKQLDLQSLFTEIGRQIARAQGWVEQRRTVQFWFIIVFGTGAIGAFMFFVKSKRDLCKRFTLAVVGFFFLLCFIIIRAAGFHHFDEILRFEFRGARMNWVFELSGIYLIFLGGAKELLALRRGMGKGAGEG